MVGFICRSACLIFCCNSYICCPFFLCSLAGFSHVCHKPQETKAIYRSKGFPWIYRFYYWGRRGKHPVHANIICCLCCSKVIHLISCFLGRRAKDDSCNETNMLRRCNSSLLDCMRIAFSVLFFFTKFRYESSISEVTNFCLELIKTLWILLDFEIILCLVLSLKSAILGENGSKLVVEVFVIYRIKKRVTYNF